MSFFKRSDIPTHLLGYELLDLALLDDTVNNPSCYPRYLGIRLSRSDMTKLKQLLEARQNDRFIDDGPEMFFDDSDSEVDSEVDSEDDLSSSSSMDYDADTSCDDESSSEDEPSVKQEPIDTDEPESQQHEMVADDRDVKQEPMDIDEPESQQHEMVADDRDVKQEVKEEPVDNSYKALLERNGLLAMEAYNEFNRRTRVPTDDSEESDEV